MDCETCAYYMYDDDYEDYICTADIDEDEAARIFREGKGCPYYRNGDEYAVVRKQN